MVFIAFKRAFLGSAGFFRPEFLNRLDEIIAPGAVGMGETNGGRRKFHHRPARFHESYIRWHWASWFSENLHILLDRWIDRWPSIWPQIHHWWIGWNSLEVALTSAGCFYYDIAHPELPASLKWRPGVLVWTDPKFIWCSVSSQGILGKPLHHSYMICIHMFVYICLILLFDF